ncbi:MAG: hypothetical protein JRG80_21460 [Deltaproteobacteria bacterium]|nr:hypothetical protein [Deltaproteobacteria bacterium]MBW2668021.1 hypothetical protein [Deltaproteobacteria bacterium]
MMKQAWIAIALGTILATGILPQPASAGDVEENIDNRQDRREDVRDEVNDNVEDRQDRREDVRDEVNDNVEDRRDYRRELLR